VIRDQAGAIELALIVIVLALLLLLGPF